MALTLAYLSDLSRVRITPDSLPPDTTVRLQRSVNEVRWFDVRGGLDLAVDGSGDLEEDFVDDYEFRSDVLNHYRVSPVDPPAGLLLDGTAGTWASTPDDDSLDITGDLTIRADVKPDEWFTTAGIVGKWEESGDERSYGLLISGGNLMLVWSTDGTSGGVETVLSTEDVPVTVVEGSSSDRLAVRADLDVDDGSGDAVVTFYTAESLDGPWSQLGDPVTVAGTTEVHAGTAEVQVGAVDSLDLWEGSILAVEVWDGLSGGTLVADPVFSAQDHGAGSFDDDAGLTWTMQANATIVGQTIVTDSITPALDSVWLKSIRWPFLNRPIRVILTDDEEITRPARRGVFEVEGRSVPVIVHDKAGSRRYPLRVRFRADELDDAHALELAVAASGTFLIHVPASSGVPGGYVSIGDLGRRRRSTVGPVTFELPLIVAAVPAADVVGGTMTWGEVETLHGSWAAVEAAYPAWADILDAVADPDALVTL